MPRMLLNVLHCLSGLDSQRRSELFGVGCHFFHSAYRQFCCVAVSHGMMVAYQFPTSLFDHVLEQDDIQDYLRSEESPLTT